MSDNDNVIHVIADISSVVGTGITNIEQTYISTDPSEPNELTIYTSNGESYKAYIPNFVCQLPTAVKEALLTIAEKATYVDEGGPTYYQALYDALYPALSYIEAVFSQGEAVITTFDTLDSLKQYLTVTAYYTDSSLQDVTADAVLTGDLTVGASTITVEYEGFTDAFEVIVTQA